jgi:hypothetical protein
MAVSIMLVHVLIVILREKGRKKGIFDICARLEVFLLRMKHNII